MARASKSGINPRNARIVRTLAIIRDAVDFERATAAAPLQVAVAATAAVATMAPEATALSSAAPSNQPTAKVSLPWLVISETLNIDGTLRSVSCFVHFTRKCITCHFRHYFLYQNWMPVVLVTRGHCIPFQRSLSWNPTSTDTPERHLRKLSIQQVAGLPDTSGLCVTFRILAGKIQFAAIAHDTPPPAMVAMTAARPTGRRRGEGRGSDEDEEEEPPFME